MLTGEWEAAIARFLGNERAGGKPRTTIDARRQHLQHMARRVGCGPWEVTGDMLREYVAGQDWAPETRRGRRTTLDRFYTLALDDGLIDANPVDRLPRVRASPGRARGVLGPRRIGSTMRRSWRLARVNGSCCASPPRSGCGAPKSP